jgi:hypothetical protein
MSPDPELERAFADAEIDVALAALSPSQRAQLLEYWIDRATGELTTALSFEFVLDDLRIEGAPAALLGLAETCISDEHAHAEWCLRWAGRIDPATPRQPRLAGTRPATFEGATEHDNRLLRAIFGCCFSETVAVHVLLAAQARITWPSVKRLNHRHLREELGHARLGWAVLASPILTRRDRDMLRGHVPELVSLTREVWCSTRPADEVLHAAGYLSGELVTRAREDAIESVVLPGIARFAGA